MTKIDCGVFPSRGEGWNLEALELMACGKHVIATDYSAHTEFCTKDNADLVTITEKELAFDNKWFHGQGGWAKISEPQVEQLASYMKEFHLKQKRHTINQNGVETALKFSWDNTARKIIEYV
jgi:glycosyltransferase involved in cell wall biosynthesis